MEKNICSVCGELVSEGLKHCPYCDSVFVSVEDVKNDIISDDNMYSDEVSDSYESYYS